MAWVASKSGFEGLCTGGPLEITPVHQSIGQQVITQLRAGLRTPYVFLGQESPLGSLTFPRRTLGHVLLSHSVNLTRYNLIKCVINLILIVILLQVKRV